MHVASLATSRFVSTGRASTAEIDEDRIFVTGGVTSALCLISTLLARPGDTGALTCSNRKAERHRNASISSLPLPLALVRCTQLSLVCPPTSSRRGCSKSTISRCKRSLSTAMDWTQRAYSCCLQGDSSISVDANVIQRRISLEYE